ncbi:uncharacterized protein IWZ02DRAFT_449862 [Phyllosticta citriasiana]|uniref:uncharacterized protein n=1 Tax=Phyllosticta citriasiana TaxID=595635 RepID=UPI0030FD88E9
MAAQFSLAVCLSVCLFTHPRHPNTPRSHLRRQTSRSQNQKSETRNQKSKTSERTHDSCLPTSPTSRRRRRKTRRDEGGGWGCKARNRMVGVGCFVLQCIALRWWWWSHMVWLLVVDRKERRRRSAFMFPSSPPPSQIAGAGAHLGAHGSWPMAPVGIANDVRIDASYVYHSMDIYRHRSKADFGSLLPLSPSQ